MSSRVEDLRDLAQMLDEGKISRREYEVVKAEILAAPAEEWDEMSPAANNGDGGAAENGHPEPTAPDPGLAAQIEQLKAPGVPGAPVNGADVSSGGPASAEQAASDGVETDGGEESWKDFLLGLPKTYRYAAAGALLVILGFVFFGSDGTGKVKADASAQSAAVGSPIEIPVGSLDVRFEDLADEWNSLERSPFILKGISVTPEAGPMDSFIYRFDDAALVAGAYNPDDGFIYALMVKTGIYHPDISNMYVHVCSLLHPGSQDCLNSFIDNGDLFGKSMEEFDGVTYQTSWDFEGREWRLEITDNVETIRVLGNRDLG